MHHEVSFPAALTLLILPAALFSTRAIAADPRDAYEARVYESGKDKLPYRLLKPRQYDGKKSYPLVLFLHGAGERGNDNKKQLIHGMGEFASDAVAGNYPAFVVAPQCPSGKQWVNVPWSADRHTMPTRPSTPLRMAIELVATLEKEFSIDANRIYVTGLSMGGFGTWDAIQRHPGRFAAAAPICGGGDSKLAKRIARVPIWAFHGGSDGVVKPHRSRDMIEAIKKAGGSPRYTEYPNTGHNSWKPAYNDPHLYRWLFSQRLGTVK